jgi:predicted MPP superfamily phosphohydrolase
VSNIKLSGSRIPAAFSGFRIAQISDLHNNNAYGKDEFMRLYSRILAQMDYGSLGE